MKKILALALPLLLTVLSARADVIWQELYNYPNGTITNESGGLWLLQGGTAGQFDAFVFNHRELVGSSPAFAEDVHRLLAITPNSPYTNAEQVLYASFIINFTNVPTPAGAYFAHFGNNSTGFEGKLWALTGFSANPGSSPTNFVALPNTFRLGVSGAGSGNPSKVLALDLALNTDYQVVLGWDPVTADAVTLWINPISSSDPSVTSGDIVTPFIALAFDFRQATGFGGFTTISNLVLATTFAEAATNVMATNAVAPKIVYQPVGVTNFVGSSVTLSAVAAGQGQGNLTYQWQTNGVSISNPAGNTNALTLDNGNAQTTDSGNYTLVVTTSYGLSVTSSVAKVLISATPIPPSFITQPVSQNLFTGQNMILTTSVSSPGNCTFTWYSNNTAVATTGPDNSGASTFEIDNVAPTNSATYEVAVTNDVAASGIVSSNAVVTVVNPQHVTIGFLRTLVDPATFLPTNSVTPYQVTGTVTTLTNITSGTTSSYYLQDGTAGINIFITGTSTFRPAQGAVVTFVGVLSSFTSGLELEGATTIPYTSWVDTGTTNTVPAPIAIPFTVTNNLSNLNYNIAGSLVTLANVFFGTNGGNTISTTANVTVGVTNASGQPFFVLFSSQDLDTAGQTLPAFASSVTGIMYGTSTNQLFVTRFADIVTTIAPSPIPLTMISSGGTLTFTWSDPSFSLQSSTNVLGPYATIPGASSGFMTNAAPDQPEMFFRLAHP